MGLPDLEQFGVSVASILTPEYLLTRETVEGIIFSALEELGQVAREESKAQPLAMRDLAPADLGFPNQAWNEQTGTTTSAYEASQISADTMADDTWVVIWGLMDNSDNQVASLLRMDIGGARVVQWELNRLWSSGNPSRVGITINPVIITKNKEMTANLYIKQGAGRNGSIELVYLGAVAEIEGTTLRT